MSGALLAPGALEAHLAMDVQAAAGGDRDAFGRLVAATSGVVCAVALAIVRDVPASQDIAQEVFLAAWTGLPRLRDPASFLPWVRQITRYQARHWLRERAVRRGDDAALADLPDAAPTGEARLLADEERRALAEAFEALPEDAREVITLYYREGASTAQLADLLGVSEAAVRQRLARARAALRDDVLARLGETLKKSGPGAAFAAAVVGLTVAAPPTAAAATLAGLGSGASLLAKLATAASGAALGLAGGLAGVLLGLRPHLREAVDDHERAALRRFRRVAVLVTIAAATGFTLTGVLRSAALGIGTQVAFGAAMAWLYMVRLPRLTARADAIRVAADPAFARKLRVRRICGHVAYGVGFGVSTAALLYALVTTGML